MFKTGVMLFVGFLGAVSSSFAMEGKGALSNHSSISTLESSEAQRLGQVEANAEQSKELKKSTESKVSRDLLGSDFSERIFGFVDESSLANLEAVSRSTYPNTQHRRSCIEKYEIRLEGELRSFPEQLIRVLPLDSTKSFDQLSGKWPRLPNRCLKSLRVEIQGRLHPTMKYDEVASLAFTPVEVRYLGAMVPNLEELTVVTDGKLRDQHLIALSTLSGLRKLALQANDSSQITDNGIRYLAGGLKRLEELSISGTGITGTGLGYLSALQQLRVLHLEDSRNIDDDALVHLSKLSKLEGLSLSQGPSFPSPRSPFTGRGLSHLAPIASSLRSLNISWTPFKRENFQFLSAFVGLWELQMAGLDDIREEDLTYLRPLTQLRRLSMPVARGLGDPALLHLLELPHLNELQFNETQISRWGIEEFAARRRQGTVFEKPIFKLVNLPPASEN